ncbi:MAG: hypothetical protein GF355_17375, partial [Candidatus Eisenbacteria bacterium]|nr:hypothetical protein [Candidatus Eisenbacteria bacterium]
TGLPAMEPRGRPAGSADQLLTALLEKGLEERATCIHIGPGPRGPRLLFRVEGELHDFSAGELGSQLALSYRAITQRLKALARCDLAERRRPQEGRFRLERMGTPGDGNLGLRLTVLPTREGEALAIHLGESRDVPETIEDLGFSERIARGLMEAVGSPHGIFLCVGPHAAGKSMTLWACARYLESTGRKVLALTSGTGPSVPNILQVDFNPESGPEAAGPLAYIDGIDPDVLLVDEISSGDAAARILEWARSGRKVLAAVEALDAGAGVSYLQTLTHGEHHVWDQLSGLLAQRLLRAVCPECARSVDPDREQVATLSAWALPSVSWREGEGCTACNYSGMRGRFPVGELWLPHSMSLPQNASGSLRHRQSESPRAGVFAPSRTFRAQISHVADAVEAAAAGRASLSEVLRNFNFWELQAGDAEEDGAPRASHSEAGGSSSSAEAA